MTRSVPRICDALLRARPCLFRAPRALRLRPSQKQDRPARRQGPAGASDPGHDCMPACGRGAHCLLVQLAGRSLVMRHRGVMRTARVLRAGVAGGAPRKRRGGRRARLGTVPPAATRPLGHRAIRSFAVSDGAKCASPVVSRQALGFLGKLQPGFSHAASLSTSHLARFYLHGRSKFSCSIEEHRLFKFEARMGAWLGGESAIRTACSDQTSCLCHHYAPAYFSDNG
jgi:hypothetical protein